MIIVLISNFMLFKSISYMFNRPGVTVQKVTKIADKQQYQQTRRYHERLKEVCNQTEQGHCGQRQAFTFPIETLGITLANPFGFRIYQIESSKIVYENGSFESLRFHGRLLIFGSDCFVASS